MTAAGMLPHNAEFERNLVGGILIGGTESLEQALKTHIDFSDIYQEHLRLVLRSMIRLARAGSPIDLVTIKSDLQDNGELERVGGAAILASLTDGTPRAMNIDFYAERIVRLAREREVVIAARNCVMAGTEGNGELEAAKNALLNAVQ